MGLDYQMVCSESIKEFQDILSFHDKVGSIPSQFYLDLYFLVQFSQYMQNYLVAVLFLMTQNQHKLLNPLYYNIDIFYNNFRLEFMIVGPEILN